VSGDGAWVVALDFGTTATAAAVGVGGRVSDLRLPDGASTMPSSVFADDDGRLVVGAEADNEAELRLDAYEPTPKRRAGHAEVRLGENDYAPAQLIGAVMAPVLREAVFQHDNATPGAVVLTHPVSWHGARRRVLAAALRHAAEHVGITEMPDPVFVTEPVAAAQWYASVEPPAEGAHFAVYDLGGGTFDTAVLRATGESFEVVESGGIDPLGGFDFDQLLFDYLGSRYIAAADPGLWSALSNPAQPDPDIARQRRRLQARVRLLKEGLTNEVDKRVRLPGVQDQVVVTRGEYEALIRHRVEDTVTELADTIEEAGLRPDQITAIYRIGGAARTPLVGAVMDRLRLPVKTTDHPKLVVAQGAATTPQAAPPPPPARQTPPPVDPVGERSKELWHNAKEQLLSHDIAGAKTSCEQIIILDHPHWAPRARAALERLEPPPTSEPPHEDEPALTASGSSGVQTLLDTGGKTNAAKPTVDKPASAFITAPKVGKFRRGVAAVIDILPILGIYAEGLAVAYATRTSYTWSDTLPFCTPTYRESCTRDSTSHYLSSAGHIAIIITAVVALLYVLWNWLYRQGKTGATIGQKMLRFKVLRAATEKPPGFRITRLIKITLLTAIWAFVTYRVVDDLVVYAIIR
jgi:actin-like ATPase involved in cell morphogenesis